MEDMRRAVQEEVCVYNRQIKSNMKMTSYISRNHNQATSVHTVCLSRNHKNKLANSLAAIHPKQSLKLEIDGINWVQFHPRVRVSW